MTSIPFFGLAVHAVLPYLKANPLLYKKRNKLHQQFSRVIMHHNNYNTYDNGFIPVTALQDWFKNPQPRLRILAAWYEIINLMDEYDEVWIEPSFSQWRQLGEPIYRPDLALRKGRKIHVVEIKTTQNDLATYYIGTRLRKQVTFATRILQQQRGDDYDVGGRALVFHNDTETPITPLWLEIAPKLEITPSA